MEGRNRKSIRLKGYDYSFPGLYFITICTYKRECLFVDIIDGKMCLSAMGEIVDKYWNEIPKHYPLARLDEYVIMPNHIHGIIEIIDERPVGNGHIGMVGNRHACSLPGNGRQYAQLPIIIGSYKSSVTRQSRKNDNQYVVWQKSYYEHIIRDETELNGIRTYIATNPINWATDQNNITI